MKRPQQLLHIINRNTQVGIAEDAVTASRRRHAETHRGPFAGVAFRCDQLQLRPALRIPLYHLSGVVTAAVVDHDHLGGQAHGRQVMLYPIQRGR